MIIHVSERKYPTITTLRELCNAIYGHVPGYTEKHETASLRSRRLIQWTDAPEPEWMTIREACKRLVRVGEAIQGQTITVLGIDI